MSHQSGSEIALPLVVSIVLALVMIHFIKANRAERFAECMAEKHDRIVCDVYARAPEKH